MPVMKNFSQVIVESDFEFGLSLTNFMISLMITLGKYNCISSSLQQDDIAWFYGIDLFTDSTIIKKNSKNYLQKRVTKQTGYRLKIIYMIDPVVVTTDTSKMRSICSINTHITEWDVRNQVTQRKTLYGIIYLSTDHKY